MEKGYTDAATNLFDNLTNLIDANITNPEDNIAVSKILENMDFSYEGINKAIEEIEKLGLSEEDSSILGYLEDLKKS